MELRCHRHTNVKDRLYSVPEASVKNEQRPRVEGPQADFPSEEEISARAYEMCLLERDSTVASVDYWRAAESELLDRAARKIIKSQGKRRGKP
jgi:hypothetical protein